MSKILELKQAIEKLETNEADLIAKKKELESWHSMDLNRRDGSTRQDEMHERMGREASDDVYSAEQKVVAQKKLVVALANAI